MSTAALLRAAGVGLGDEVIVPAFGNVDVTEAVMRTGALPVFADIDPVTYCLDPLAVGAAVTPRTAAVVVVHRFGRPAEIGRMHELGERHGLLVLERGRPRRPGTRSRSGGSGPRSSTLGCVGCGRPTGVTGTRTSSTWCGCRGTGGPIGTHSREPCGARELTAGCR